MENPRHYSLSIISSTYVDILFSENLFFRNGIKKVLTVAAKIPKIWITILQTNFVQIYKISFTCAWGVVFLSFLRFTHGFLTADVEKFLPENHIGKFHTALSANFPYSQFVVNSIKEISKMWIM